MKIWNNILGGLCAILLLIMTGLGAINAVLRYSSKWSGTTLSSNAFLELQWYLFSAVFLLGAAYTFYHDRHVRVDVLYGRLKPKHRQWVDRGGTILFLIPFCCFGIWSSWEFVSNSWSIQEVSSDAGGLIRYPVKSLIPLGFMLLLLQSLVWWIQSFYTDRTEIVDE